MSFLFLAHPQKAQDGTNTRAKAPPLRFGSLYSIKVERRIVNDPWYRCRGEIPKRRTHGSNKSPTQGEFTTTKRLNKKTFFVHRRQNMAHTKRVAINQALRTTRACSRVSGQNAPKPTHARARANANCVSCRFSYNAVPCYQVVVQTNIQNVD
jgi:hypothetical protein